MNGQRHRKSMGDGVRAPENVTVAVTNDLKDRRSPYRLLSMTTRSGSDHRRSLLDKLNQ